MIPALGLSGKGTTMEMERDPRLPGAGEGGAAEQASPCLDCWPESKPVRKEGG